MHNMYKSPPKAMWLSNNPDKRWVELFFLYYSLFWITWFGAIVAFKAYESFGKWEYMLVGLAMAIPCILVPLILNNLSLRGNIAIDTKGCYFVKANLWIGIFSFVGNYFWTHYFYTMLGARYTFPAHRLNDVPISMFFCTHAYFCSYHTATSILLRRFWTSGWYTNRSNNLIRRAASGSIIFAMAYATAFMETWTISSFPYWDFKNRSAMYSIGSICYALYFLVSFPMFFRLDEKISHKWSYSAVAIDAAAACMIVTTLLDFWRLSIGPIAFVEQNYDIPFIYQMR